MHIYTAHGQRQQCGEGGDGVEAGWWGAKGQKMGDICNTVNNNFLIETLKNAALEEIPLNSS